MEFSRPPLVIAFELSEPRKAIVADILAGVSDVVYLTELDGAARAKALRDAGVLLTFNRRLMHGIGMRVHAINRHGWTNERVDWIGTPERLNELLEAANVLVISAPSPVPLAA